MNTTNSRIIYLWQQFSARQATRAELDELMELLSSGSHDEESRQYLQQLLADTPAGEEDPARWEPILQSILHPVRTLEPYAEASESLRAGASRPYAEVGDASVAGRPSPVRLWVRHAMTAAAVVLLLVGLFRLWRSYRAESVVQAPVVVVAPGGNRAVLTLAGGQKILLDSAATGVLAEQGNTHVQKLGDGKLAYEAGGGGDEAGRGGHTAGAAAPLYNTLTTPRGGQYQLTLPDGTKVWLNAASSLTYPTAFTGNNRTVEMTGEAYFEVVHDKKRPFMVKAGGQTIEDIGTQFNVNAYTDEPAQVTTLLEGAVKVDGHLLRPGEKATVTGATATSGGGGIEVTKGDPDQAVAWKNGLFNFTDAGLQTVMRQLSRWYNVDVTYEGNIPPRQFTGMIGRSLTLNQVLKGLAKERVHYQIEEGNKLIITP
jgi:ferric-dicitrate binding protein FerR (iron transport regulator)